ncbi:hypothetical protein [Sulfitobacter pacificus]|uniref:hypothetical protein n=1 Tax=Sulfitobacter pacificus TaxID=1499314 RepID=UPI003102D21B
MSLLDEIIEDRDAGPKVDWELEKEGGSWGRASGTIHGYIFMSCIMDDHDGADEVNARRIARVPQLEQAYIDLRRAADELVEASEDFISHLTQGDFISATRESRYEDALTAYRAAIGDA